MSDANREVGALRTASAELGDAALEPTLVEPPPGRLHGIDPLEGLGERLRTDLDRPAEPATDPAGPRAVFFRNRSPPRSHPILRRDRELCSEQASPVTILGHRWPLVHWLSPGSSQTGTNRGAESNRDPAPNPA